MTHQEEVKRLKWRIEFLEESVKEYSEVVSLYQKIDKDGAIYVNTNEVDCDGVERNCSYKFTNLNEYFEEFKYFNEQEFEGSHSWDVVRLEDAYTENEQGTFGQGWDIH